MTAQQAENIEDLGQRFAEALNQDDPLVSGLVPLLPAVWRILADGRPASPAEIASASGRPISEVSNIIAGTAQAEVDRDGRVLGAGLTLIPTPHRVLLPGVAHQLYVWCVPDAFAVSALLHQPLRVISPCHATGRPVNVDLEPDQVRAVDPAAAVVAFVTDLDVSDTRGSVCVHQNLFVDAEAAAPWLAQHPHADIVPVADGYRVLAPFLAEITARTERGS
ncbi:MAG: organomercurial lyase [Actinomycetota bacterium]|nr:organomercurial lyase [Actinomycetota bacterium]